jgi:hypothetical protein
MMRFLQWINALMISDGFCLWNKVKSSIMMQSGTNPVGLNDRIIILAVTNIRKQQRSFYKSIITMGSDDYDTFMVGNLIVLLMVPNKL